MRRMMIGGSGHGETVESPSPEMVRLAPIGGGLEQYRPVKVHIGDDRRLELLVYGLTNGEALNAFVDLMAEKVGIEVHARETWVPVNKNP